MAFVQEPVLFVWVFLPNSKAVEIQKGICELAAQHELKAVSPPVTAQINSGEVSADLATVGERRSGLLISRSAQSMDHRPFAHVDRDGNGLLARFERTTAQGAKDECLLHAYHEVLVIQIAVSKQQDWKGTLVEGFNELMHCAKRYFECNGIITGRVYGISSVYWALTADELSADSYAEEIRLVVGESDLPSVSTDFGGRLSRSERPTFPGLEVSQDIWLLVTPRFAEFDVNRRFNQPFHNAPPTFATMALAGHKVHYEEGEHELEISRMKLRREGIDRDVSVVVNAQRTFGSQLDDLRSRESEKLGEQLAEVGAALADYRNSVNVLKRLRRTIAIDRRNYLVNGVELISAEGKLQIERSVDWEKTALVFLSNLKDDRIFLPQIGRIQAIFEQLDSEIDYAESVCEAHTASLRAVSDQLRIAGERQLGEMAHHLSIDSAAVVASIFAVIAVETVLKDAGSNLAPWFITLFLVAGSFGVTQLLSSRWRGGWGERASLALAGGCLGCYLMLTFGGTMRRVLTEIGWNGVLSLFEYDALLLVLAFTGGSIPVGLVHWLGSKRKNGNDKHYRHDAP